MLFTFMGSGALFEGVGGLQKKNDASRFLGTYEHPSGE